MLSPLLMQQRLCLENGSCSSDIEVGYFASAHVASRHNSLRQDFSGSVLRTVAASLLLLLGACSVAPVPVAKEDLLKTAREDIRVSKAAMPPIAGTLTLQEAIARALKYNLDHRVATFEQALAAGQFEAGRYDMLPKLLAGAGYNTRDSDLTRRATDSVTGIPSLANPFVSSERAHSTSDLTFSWNVLDFGASYYSSKQQADRVLIATERRRKAMLTLIRNVRVAYWKAIAAQKLRDEVKSALIEAEAGLVASQRIESDRVKAPVEALRYQRTLLENIRLLENVERELSISRIELTSLIGLVPGSSYTLAESESILPVLDPVKFPMETMEAMALSSNPDLREQAYNGRIAAAETRRTLLRLLPGLSFDYGSRRDNDGYLINQQWYEAGARVSFNLFNLLSAPSQMNAAEKGVAVAEQRRMALQMSVLTQVHLARQLYDNALLELRRADTILGVDQRLLEFSNSQQSAQTGTALERVSASASAILSLLRRYQAMAKAHEAVSTLQATLGVEPDLAASIDDVTLPELSGRIEKFLLLGVTPATGTSTAPQTQDVRLATVNGAVSVAKVGEPALSDANENGNSDTKGIAPFVVTGNALGNNVIDIASIDNNEPTAKGITHAVADRKEPEAKPVIAAAEGPPRLELNDVNPLATEEGEIRINGMKLSLTLRLINRPIIAVNGALNSTDGR